MKKISAMNDYEDDESYQPFPIQRLTLSNSATGRTIEIDARMMVKKLSSIFHLSFMRMMMIKA